jgi:hypothetical protein
MHWRFGIADSGCYRFHCGSSEFKRFAKRQIMGKPTTFAEIEGELAA